MLETTEQSPNLRKLWTAERSSRKGEWGCLKLESCWLYCNFRVAVLVVVGLRLLVGAASLIKPKAPGSVV